MTVDDKILITSSILFFIISLILYYRNLNYDRALCLFFVSLGLIDFVQYCFIKNTIQDQSGAELIHILFWSGPFLLFLSLFLFFIHHSADYFILFLSLIGFIFYLIIFVYKSTETIEKQLVLKDGKILWIRDKEGFVESYWQSIYWIGILVPFLLLFGFYHFKNISLVVLMLYIIFTALLSYHYENDYYSLSLWSSLMVGVALLSFVSGVFNQSFSSNI